VIDGAVVSVQDITVLEDMERSRHEFLGMVSHELRSPLAVIKATAETILRAGQPLDVADADELREVVSEQVSRMKELLDNLLDISAVESGHLAVRSEPLDLCLTAEEAIAIFRRSTGNRRKLELLCPSSLPLVSADRCRILQVLTNLLSNANKFSPPEGEIRVEVEYRAGAVAVKVSDHGMGIPPEMQDRLFRKFSRLNTRVEGTGLGLVISKGIIEAHGGKIRAESAGEGKGAAFTFTLPGLEGDDSQSPSPAAPRKGGRGE